MVLMITSLYLDRFVQTVLLWEFLSNLLRLSPIYLAFTGLLWTLVGLPVAWGLWRGRPGAPKATRIAALAFVTFYWLDRLLVADASGVRSNWPFTASVTFILLTWIFWIFSQRKVKAFFGELHD